MSQPIAIKINRDKIDKTRLFKGAKGTYLDAVLIPTPDSQYEQDYMVVQSVSREEREKGVKGPIIGSAKFIERKVEMKPAPQKSSGVKPDDDGSDIPF